jgi:hypothetical protein
VADVRDTVYGSDGRSFGLGLVSKAQVTGWEVRTIATISGVNGNGDELSQFRQVTASAIPTSTWLFEQVRQYVTVTGLVRVSYANSPSALRR